MVAGVTVKVCAESTLLAILEFLAIVGLQDEEAWLATVTKFFLLKICDCLSMLPCRLPASISLANARLRETGKLPVELLSLPTIFLVLFCRFCTLLVI